MQWTCNVTLRRARVTVFCRGKTIISTYSEWVFGALRYQACKPHAPYYVSSMSCMDWPYFSKLTHKRQDIRNKSTEDKVLACVSFSSATLSEKCLILRRIQRHIFKNVHTSSCKISLFLQDLNEIWIFSTAFRNNSRISKFHVNSSSRSRVVP
jgi:hypothetical protein